MRYLILCLCYGLTAAFGQSDVDKIKKIANEVDMKVKAFQEKGNLSSVSYALVLDGKIVHESYEGLINQQTQKKSDNRSVYRIASMSKSFAGMAILQLRDAGKLRLDDPVTRYIPELKGQKYSPDSPEITIRNLLTHSAGFPEDNPWGDRQLGISTQEMLDMFKKGISFSTEPGLTYEYSNMAFAMLGYIIQQVSGQTYQQFISENIWKPLDMNNTYWDYAKVPENDLVHGYRWVYEKFVEQPFEGDGAYGIMGGILTSIDDFAKYMALHQAAYQQDSTNSKILKKSSLKEMHYAWNFNSVNKRGYKGTGELCDNTSFYGYGLRIDKNCENITMIGHSGGLPGFGSDWKFLPQYGLGIVTLANGTYGSAALLNNELLPFVIEKAKLSPKPFPVSSILKQRQEELVTLLPSWENAKSSGIFAVNFFDDYYVDLLQKDTEKAYNQMGKIKKVNEIVAQNALRGTFLVEGEKANLEISFTLSPENPPLIQAYSVKTK